MTSEWPKVRLEDVATEVTVGFVGPMTSEYRPMGVPFLRSQDIEPLWIDTGNTKYISRKFHERIQKSALAPGDVVIVRTGRPGAAAVVPDTLVEANCSDLVIARPGPQLDPRFLAYYVNSTAAVHVASHLVGAVQQHYNVGSARTMEILLPPLSEQKAMVQVLGALDDKIEVNRRVNETLEAIARALFKSWFVDFDPVRAKAEGRQPAGMDPETAALFPSEFEESELGEIPFGWSVSAIGSLLQLHREPLNPDDHADEVFDHYSMPAYDEGKWPVTEHGRTMKSLKLLVHPDSVLLAKLNPHIPRIWMPQWGFPHRSVCSTEFLVLVPRSGASREYLYSLFCFAGFLTAFRSLATGTSNSQQRVRPDEFLGMQIPAPPRQVITRYTSIVAPLQARIACNLAESSQLAVIRDALLPKLLSGEIRVTEVPEIVVG